MSLLATTMTRTVAPLSSSAAALTGAERVVVVNGRDVRIRLAGPIVGGGLTLAAAAALEVLSAGWMMVTLVPLLFVTAWAAHRWEHPSITNMNITLDLGRGQLHVMEDGVEHKVPLGLASIVVETFDGTAVPLLRLGLRTWKITGSPAMTADDVVELLTELGVPSRVKHVNHRKTLPQAPESSSSISTL